MLGEPALAAAVPHRRRYEIICHLVGDLARPPGVPQGLVDALIALAERRVDRDAKPQTQSQAAPLGRRR